MPASWGIAGAFPSLSILDLYNMPLAGTLPDAWGSSRGSLPSLETVYLGANDPGLTLLSGALVATTVDHCPQATLSQLSSLTAANLWHNKTPDGAL